MGVAFGTDHVTHVLVDMEEAGITTGTDCSVVRQTLQFQVAQHCGPEKMKAVVDSSSSMINL